MIVRDMHEETYHSRPELSSTQARLLLKSAALFRYAMDHPRSPKRVFDVGSAAHTKILGEGSNVIEYPEEHLTPSGNVSTKGATLAWAEEKRAEGLIPVSPADVADVNGMAEAVLAHPDSRPILERLTQREVTIIQEIDGVPVRARFDLYGAGEAADLKSGRDASPSGFNRSIARYGYFVQRRWYDDTNHAETGDRLHAFPLIIVESTAPYLVGVYDLDFMYDERAGEKCREARRRYRECTETGIWPGYARTTLTAPSWVIYEDADEEIQV